MQPDGKVVLAAPQAQSGDGTKGDFSGGALPRFPRRRRATVRLISTATVWCRQRPIHSCMRIALGMTGNR